MQPIDVDNAIGPDIAIETRVNNVLDENNDSEHDYQVQVVVYLLSPSSGVRQRQQKVEEMPHIPILLLVDLFRNLMRPVQFELNDHCHPYCNTNSVVYVGQH